MSEMKFCLSRGCSAAPRCEPRGPRQRFRLPGEVKYTALYTFLNLFSSLSSKGLDSPPQTRARHAQRPVGLLAGFRYELFFFKHSFWPLYAFIHRTAQDMSGNRMRQRGSDMQRRDPGRDSNLGPLHMGLPLYPLS